MKKSIFIYVLMVVLLLLPLPVYAAEDTPDDSSYGKQIQQDADGKADNSADKAQSYANNTIEKIKSRSSGINSGTGNRILISVLRVFYRMYCGVKAIGGYIFIISELIGILMYVLSRKNKKTRRLGVYGFMLVIPLLLFAFIYGVGTLNGIYLHEAGQTVEFSESYIDVYENYNVFKSTGNESIFVLIMNSFYNTYLGIVQIIPALIMIFVAQGLIRVFFCKYDPAKRNLGLYGYCIAIPIMLVIAIVGVGFIGSIFK